MTRTPVSATTVGSKAMASLAACSTAAWSARSNSCGDFTSAMSMAVVTCTTCAAARLATRNMAMKNASPATRIGESR